MNIFLGGILIKGYLLQGQTYYIGPNEKGEFK